MGADTKNFLGNTEIPRITKPFDVQKLSVEIESYIHKHRAIGSNTARGN
jgi:hypothetical protein